MQLERSSELCAIAIMPSANHAIKKYGFIVFPQS